MTPHDLTTFDPRIADWLEDDPNNAPDQALDIVLAALPSIKQRHASRLPRRFTMTTLPRLALGAAAAIVVVVLAGAFLVRPPASGVGGGGPTPSPSTAPASVAPSTPPSPSPSAASGPLDTSTWATYTSTRYGFTIGRPADWSLIPSNRLWAFPADTTCCPPQGTETFLSPFGDVGVSVWSVALPKGTTADAWIPTYCAKIDPDSPCTALQSSTVPASMDGRAGRLVQFKSDTQAFIPVGDRLYIVACWRPENDPSVLPYGGARRLIEGYLSTMRLVPGGPASPAPSATARPS
jgi:hypothetical protein